MLLVAQSALAASMAARLVCLRFLIAGGPAANPLLLPACLAVALLSGGAVLMNRRRHRVLMGAIARNDSLRIEVDTDSLTGLANRRAFDAALAVALGHAVRTGTGLSLIVIDIDHFKAFNDSYGHVEGDRVLRTTGRTIQEVLEAGLLAYRIGGEELAVILPATPIVEAARHARLIQAAVGSMRRPHMRGIDGFLTVSIGVAEGFPAAAPLPAETLIEAADRALYEAKAAGRACVRLAAIAPAAPADRATDDDSVDGLDILLPNGSRLAINSRIRLATVGSILRMVSAAGSDAAGPETG